MKVALKAKEVKPGSGPGNLTSRLVFAGERWRTLDLCVHGQQLRWRCAECEQYFKEQENPKPQQRFT